MCSISDDPGISFWLPARRYALLAFKLIFFLNLTARFNYRTQASNIFQQLSLSSFVIINMGHPDRSPSTNPFTWLVLQQEQSTRAGSQFF